MHQVILFALLGLGTGALTAGLSLGLVSTYRGSGIINLAVGAVAMVSGYAFWAFNTGDFGPHIGKALSFVLAIIVALAVGVVMELLAFRPLRTASPVVKLVACVGILLAAQATMLLAFGPFPKTEPSILPNAEVTVLGYAVPEANLILAGIVIVVTALLWALYRWSRFGLETKASFENETSANLIGLSVNRLSMTNTLVASLIAGAIGVLAAPVTTLDSQVLPLAVVPALAAALFADFTSFPVACVAGLLLGALQNVLYYVSTLSWFPTDHGVAWPGVQQVLVLVAIVIALWLRGNRLPQRGEHVEKRLPIVPRPERLLQPAVLACVVGVAALLILPFDFRQALVNTIIAAALTLSIIVITGFVGQMSIMNLALAGVAGYLVSHLATGAGIGFPLGPIIGALGATVVGLLVGVSALRVRGVQLAVVTLAAAVAIENAWFTSNTVGGGQGGAPVPQPHLFGLNLGNNGAFRGLDGKLPSPVLGIGILVVTILLGLLVANLRRSQIGQRMLAVRANERAAAAAGINVRNIKLIGFGLSSFIAGVAGAMYAYNFGSISATTFNVLSAFGVITFAFVGGITMVSGSLFAGLIATEALIPHAMEKWFGISGTWALLFGGVAVIFNLVLYPEGAAGAALRRKLKRQRLQAEGALPRGDIRRLWEPVRAKLSRPTALAPGRGRGAGAAVALGAGRAGARVRPQALRVGNLTVRFGGVTAVNDVSLSIAPGEIVGLIGPNGAGKSTLIDALSGFVPLATGTITLGEKDLTRTAPHQRVHAGLVRSWQSVDLFDDVSVRENMEVASERPAGQALLEVVWPRRHALAETASAAVSQFALGDDLERLPVELSFSQRRMVTTARAVALNPSVLLLDEPAGGFSDVRRHELAEAIAPLARERGMGLLVVDHDMPFVMGLCDRIVVLNFGEKIADGTPDEVRANPEVISAYLRGDAEERAEEEHELVTAARSRHARRAGRERSVLLAARDMAVGYYDHPVVRGIDLEVRPGEVVALLGANRAGKTTTLLGLAGAIQPLAGEVYWLGEQVSKRVPLHRRAAQGLGFLTDERAVFQQLTVTENLRVDARCDAGYVLRLFPELEDHLNRRAGLLSGGQQQMLGLGRALARHPKVLLVDEMSLGLAPIMVARLMEVLRQAADDQGVGVVLVEQHVQEALRISDRVCVVAGGRMTLAGNVEDVVDRVEDAFLADVLGQAA
ncbi:MAG: ATP-binding cassette domain-containing protein [Solirubrobacterales bacterium]|nr:ATP-binding cassette domain-containing protein [Solirubrobacterales bacterium]